MYDVRYKRAGYLTPGIFGPMTIVNEMGSAHVFYNPAVTANPTLSSEVEASIAWADVRGATSDVYYDGPLATAGVEAVGGGTTHGLSLDCRNPFRPFGPIRFTVPSSGSVLLTVHDAAGRRVSVVADQDFKPGQYTRTWDGRNDAGRLVSPGVYFVRICAGDLTASRPLILF
jgi:hypothetical protein